MNAMSLLLFQKNFLSALVTIMKIGRPERALLIKEKTIEIPIQLQHMRRSDENWLTSRHQVREMTRHLMNFGGCCWLIGFFCGSSSGNYNAMRQTKQK